MEKLFKLKQNGTNVKTEIIAGITTFLAMAYILAVNPNYLGGIAGTTPGAIFTATAISAAIATICMAFFANYPVALASGMGLNAFFAYTVCGAMGCSYEVALTAVLVEGITENTPASGLGTYQPTSSEIIPSIHVAMIPRRMLPGILK